MRFIVNVPVTVAPTESRAPDAGRRHRLWFLATRTFWFLVFFFIYLKKVSINILQHTYNQKRAINLSK